MDSIPPEPPALIESIEEQKGKKENIDDLLDLIVGIGRVLKEKGDNKEEEEE